MVVGNTATMTWRRGISLIPSRWRFALMSRAKLNAWRDSSRCRCQRCGGCSKGVKRERSMPRSKGSKAARTGILLPSTVLKISQSQNVRERAFRSAEERNEYIRLMVYKCEGRYIFYKLWIAARILDITKDEMKLLVKDRVRPVGDIVYRCLSLAFNCKWLFGQCERHYCSH